MKKISILLLLVLFLGGCFPTGESELPKSNSDHIIITNSDNSDTIPASIDMELDKNLMVKADVVSPKSLNLKVMSVALKSFDADKVMNTLLKEKKVYATNEFIDPVFPQQKGKSFSCADGSTLNVYIGSIRYTTPYYSEREYDSVIFGSNYFVRPDIQDVYKKTELKQVDKNSAVSIVKQTIESLGFQVADKPEVIALDLDTLKSEWEDYEGKGGKHPKQWEAADEAYAVVFQIMYDSTRITNTGYINPNGEIPVEGSRILGVVTKNGLIYFQCSGIYEISSIIKESIQPISISVALEQVKNKYKDVLLTDPVTITNIALEYLPLSKMNETVSYEMIPAWVFTAHQKSTIYGEKGNYSIDSYFPIIINAETGQEFLIGGKV
jgi:hypothetical protein